jgi:hypothetical protein
LNQERFVLGVVMYGELEKAVMPWFKPISQPEKKHDNLNKACVLIEIYFGKFTVRIQVKCVTAETSAC